VKGRDQFSLLIVRGDGTKVVRFNFTRPVARGAFAGVALALSVVGALTTDWVELRELTREARTFARQIAEQRETIDAFNRRVVELRQEMVGWRELHARIWEPFGPELAPGARDKGIGGGAVKLAARIAPGDEPLGRVVRGNELERLAESVKEQGDNLRALDRLMARAGKAPSARPMTRSIRSARGCALLEASFLVSTGEISNDCSFSRTDFIARSGLRRNSVPRMCVKTQPILSRMD